jgi:TRAP-type mannitol/chloroaromatic compound transport system substrate-binding protein
MLMINKDKWEALSAADKAIFIAAAHQANSLTISKYDDVNPGAIKRLVASGTQLRTFSPEIMDACAKAASDLYEEIGAKNPIFKKLHDHVMAYRNDQLLWQQIAEFNYDAYQIRSRGRR